MRTVLRFVSVLASLSLLLLTLTSAATKYAPNHFLGKCLDASWVAEVEKNLSISASERDAIGRLKHPYLRAALKRRRYTIRDSRTSTKPISALFNSGCTSESFKFWGVGSTVNPSTGAITDPGYVNGSLVVEFKGWASHQLATMVFAILANESLGYEVSLFTASNSVVMGERMSTTGEGLCTPIHINVEEWGRKYPAFVNAIYKAGTHMYGGRSGLYTTKKFVDHGASAPQPFNADFWRDYVTDANLIQALDADLIFNNADYYPPSEAGTCPDGEMGCLNSCSRTETCTNWEGLGNKCIGVALMYHTYDNGWMESVLANNLVPSYHCFLGWSGVESYAVDMESKDIPVLFYHYEPDLFHVRNAGKFERVFLPRTRPEKVALNTGTFGEKGYGLATDNKLSVDFPTSALNKYGANLLQDHAPIATLLSRFSLADLDMHTLMTRYAALTDNATNAIVPDDILFSSGCEWLRQNYATWRLWLDRLPGCSLITHVKFTYVHCDDGQPREIHFSWLNPDPDDSTKSYVCDGSYMLQPPMKTSRSCEWLKNNYYSWIGWVIQRPPCDASFYTYTVSDCDSSAKRTATFHWLLPKDSDSTQSIECTGGVALPEPVLFDCEYPPITNPLYSVVAIIAWIMIAVLGLMIFFVIRYRNEPIVKRSQFEFLIVMILGGILMSVAATLYGGKPSKGLCAARPVVTSLGFTLIFGSLLVKSLRVYRVFMRGAMKRVVLSTARMFKILGLFVGVDVVILMAWLIFDFPSPQEEAVTMGALNGGTVYNEVCLSSSFIFTALLIFWKAIVLLVGLYLSFLIRNVSTDFQESIWIFASSLVVLFGSIVILPMAYLVDLPALVFFAFLAFMLLGCTAMVMAMMLVPKILRLHERSNDTTTMETTTGDSVSEDTKRGKASAIRTALKAQVQVTPIQEFKSKKSGKSKGRDKKKKEKKQDGPGAVNVEDSSSSSSSEN